MHVDEHKDAYIKNWDNVKEYGILDEMAEYFQILSEIKPDDADFAHPECYVGTIQYTDNSSGKDILKCIIHFVYAVNKMVRGAHPEYTDDIYTWGGGTVYSSKDLAKIINNKQSSKFIDLVNVFVFKYEDTENLDFTKPVYEKSYYMTVYLEYVGE